jgi:uncharacterized protein (DUF2249 family)
MCSRRLIDGRDLLPPEPLQLTLDALETLAPGDDLMLLLYCEPHPLYAMLERDGFRHATSLRDDGTREILITHGAGSRKDAQR